MRYAPSVSVLALSLFAVPATAQMAPSTEEAGLPYLDARLHAAGPRKFVTDAIEASRDAVAELRRGESLGRLRGDVPLVRVVEDQFFGTPHFVSSTRALLTTERGVAPVEAVRGFLTSYQGLFEIQPDELDDARVARDFVSQHNGVTHLTWQQQVAGVDLWGAELKANVTKDGELINISSTMIPRPKSGFALSEPTLDAAEALRLAALDAGIDPKGALPAPLTSPEGPSLRQTWSVTEDFRADVPLTTELVYFPLSRTDVRTAWRVVVPVPGLGHTYETTVDATSGEVLRRWNRLHFLGGGQDATFNVWTGDSPAPGSPGLTTPDGTQFPVVPRTLVTVTGAQVMGTSPNGWINDGDNETVGNNVDAHTDLDFDNVADPRPVGSPFRVFDFPVDLAQDPTSYSDAAVTNLFYHSNIYHDRLYELGWDEVSSNLQDDNFGLGGVGGDRLEADAQDGSTVNNAVFIGSGTDGSSARIQMYEWSGPSPDVDGTLDNDVVYHEISHGLSIRLSGGTVFGDQAGGMGEGWGDFFGICLNAEATDDPNGPFAMGAYATYQLSGSTDNYYFGIRRYPYSTDLGIAPLTYADVDPGQIELPPGIPVNSLFAGNPANFVHNVGEIWCQTLLQARANLWSTYGFAANDLIMQLVVDGLKLMPSTPNLLQARDAILQADLVNNGGANQADLWTAFAKRGLGVNASSPAGTTAIGVVESFDLVQFSLPLGMPETVDPQASTPFAIDIEPVVPSISIIPGTELLSYSINGAPLVSVPLTDLGGGTYSASLPPLECFDEISYFITVETTSGLSLLPPDAPAETFVARAFTGTLDQFVDDFELDMGWTVGDAGDTATTGIWERVDPVGTSAQPEDDASDPSTFCFVTGQGAIGGGLGDNDVDGGATTLFSPVVDLSAGDSKIGYDRWYSNNTGASPGADVFRVDISNGGPWVNVETVGPGGPGTGGGWIRNEFQVSDFVTPTSTVQLRFIAEDAGDGSVVEAGIDDFQVFEEECIEFCQAELGFSGPGDAVFTICGAPLATGNTADFKIVNLDPFAVTFIAIGVQNNPTPFYSGFLVPVPVAKFLVKIAKADGTFGFKLQGGSGPATVFLQAFATDPSQIEGVELSGAIQLELLP